MWLSLALPSKGPCASTRIQGQICKRLLIHETVYNGIIYHLALLIADMKYHLSLIVQIQLKREQL